MVETRLLGRPPVPPAGRHVPFGIARPVWVDDADFNVELPRPTHGARPSPGGERELRALIGRLMSQRLDRTKPLWEIWVVEGLTDDRWAMVSKVHHCMVDGVSGAEILSVLLQTSPDDAHRDSGDWHPEPAPRSTELVVDALATCRRSQYEQLRAVGRPLRRPTPAP